MKLVWTIGALAFLAGAASVLFGPKEFNEISNTAILLGIGSMMIGHGSPKD